MAKKKHHKKTTHRRKKSHMGAIAGGDLVFALVGGISGRLVDKVVPSTMNPKMIAGIKTAIGVLAPLPFKSGKAKSMAQAFGAGMAVVGVTDLLHAFGVLNGPEGSETIDVHLDGTDDLPIVNGDDLPIVNGDDLPIVNGMEDDE